MPQLLVIKPLSKLYLESHSVNSRFKADKVVNAALDAGLEREREPGHGSPPLLSSLHGS